MINVIEEIDRILMRLFDPSLSPGVAGFCELPDERPSIAHRFSVGGHEGVLTIGFYPDGRLGEVFIYMEKESSVIRGFLDSWAAAVTIGVQHGIPIDKFLESMRGTRFEPSGFTGNPEIPIATSLMDYLSRWIKLRLESK